MSNIPANTSVLFLYRQRDPEPKLFIAKGIVVCSFDHEQGGGYAIIQDDGNRVLANTNETFPVSEENFHALKIQTLALLKEQREVINQQILHLQGQTLLELAWGR